MAGQSTVARRTLVAMFILAILLLGFDVLNPYSDTTTLNRLAKVALAAFLAAGLIPGSYIHRLIESLSIRAQDRPARSISIVSIGAPLLLVGLFALAVYDEFDVLQIIDRLGITTLDEREIQFNLVGFSMFGLISLILLIWNSVDLLRSRNLAPSD